VPVVISDNLVLTLPQAVGDAPNANNPLIGWRNLVTVGNISADSEDPASPGLNLANAMTHQLWRSVSLAVQYVTVTHGAVDPIDYVGVAGHNFGSGHITVRLEGYTAVDGLGTPLWFPLVGEFMPADDTPLLMRFAPQSLVGVRIKLHPTTVRPLAAVVYVGPLLVLQRRIYVGHKPMPFAERVDNVVSRSDRGHYLGATILSAWNEGAIQQNNVESEFYRAEVEPWRKQGVMSDYPAEVAYCWPAGDMDVSNQLANGMMQFSLNVQGIVS
jgi:hypothetical protein